MIAPKHLPPRFAVNFAPDSLRRVHAPLCVAPCDERCFRILLHGNRFGNLPRQGKVNRIAFEGERYPNHSFPFSRCKQLFFPFGQFSYLQKLYLFRYSKFSI